MRRVRPLRRRTRPHCRPRSALRGGRRRRPRPRRFSVAWSGDTRAYLPLDGHLRLLTEDHNARRACDGGDRKLITACLGEARGDEETERRWGHPAIEYLRGPARPGRLLLASDGAYEPHEDAGHDLAGYLTGGPHVPPSAWPTTPSGARTN
ncbi:hypothetical protein [Streptomyces lavenduligriseus]|uniref:PPM-type phosphatase domain-containing protein n=1 Tax=Streptomyces lavenduligriseus TaxID=67315 RepID=A0ABT0P507_9ACTN|nr:hypothetical protein [Streptomyces lavenduligriseus]MCL3998817.1 hypothetical protein [Streptomyces lavenduligriseus]